MQQGCNILQLNCINWIAVLLPPHLRCCLRVALCGLAIAPWPLPAQQAPTVPVPTTVLPDVSVQARPGATDDAPDEGVAAGPASTLAGPALRARVDATLGATLQDQLGVANASFGPNVGLPIIRGQSGMRTRALIGGLSTHDASTMSADHGVMLEPGLAERITVWRGPSAVRFGGGAIGGAIEIEDGRIPEQAARTVQGRSEARAGQDGVLGLVRLSGPVGRTDTEAQALWTWRMDVHGRRQQDARIPGQAIDEAAVASQFGLVPAENSWGRLPNTDARSSGASMGLSRISEAGVLGLAVSTYQNDYGIPPGAHSHAEAVPPGVPVVGSGDLRLQAQQHRVAALAKLQTPWALFPGFELNAVHTRYKHDEVEGGTLFTTFEQQVSELRAEWTHRLIGNTAGVLGVQVQDRFFAATGLEAFVPPTDLRSLALFGTSRHAWGPWSLDLGARIEHQDTRPHGPSMLLDQPRDLPARRYTPGSISLALAHAYQAQEIEGRLTLTHWQVARAPDIPELYAGGPHHATRSFDIGNTALRTEVLRGWDLGWTHAHGRLDVQANAFIYRSPNYIYQRSLGWFYESEEGNAQAVCARLDHCLPATKYEQAAAQLHGFEAELGWRLLPGERWRVALFADAVRGRLVDGADLPRMPPRRWGLAMSARQGPWHTEWRWTRAEAQMRPGENETPTAGYVRLDGSVRWQTRLASGQRLALFLIGRNLTNQSIRNSTSFLRNYAPEPGRVIQAGLEVRW